MPASVPLPAAAAEPRPDLRPLRRGLWACLAALVLTLVAMFLTGFLPEDGFGALLREPAGKLGLLVVLLLVARGGSLRERFRLRPVSGRALGIAAGCGALSLPFSQALAALTVLPLAMLGARFDSGPTYAALQQPLGLLWGVALVLFGVAVEELFFRGYLLSRFEALGRGFAVVGSAILFATAHINWLMFPWGLVLGGYTALLTLRSNSVVPALVAHGVGNTVGIVLGAFPSLHMALSRALTVPGEPTPWVLSGSLLILTLSALALAWLLRAFGRAVPAAPQPEPGTPPPAAAPVLAGALLRSAALWSYAALLIALNLLVTLKIFRR